MLLYADEASISLTPVLSKTYAPRGQTPCITISTEISVRLYLASAISPQGDLFFMIRKAPFDSAAIIEFLELLRKQAGQKLLVIWDGASIHHSQKLRKWLEKQPTEDFFLALQPHYSPELNADEQVWQQLKNHKLKNTRNENINELKINILRALSALKQNKELIKTFFNHPNLGYL